MIEINGISYKLPINWSDIRLIDAERVYAIPMTEAMGKRIDILETSKEVEKDILEWSETVQFEEIVPYIRRVFEVLTNIDIMTLQKCDSNQLLFVYFTYLEKFVFGIKTLGANVTAEDVSSFVYDNKTYYLPKDKQVIDMSIPLEAITMQQFAEASDLLNLIDTTEDGFKFMSYAIILQLPNALDNTSSSFLSFSKINTVAPQISYCTSFIRVGY